MRCSTAWLAVLVACSGASRRDDTVILASGADLQSPNPLLTVHPLARQVQRYALLVTLVRYDSALAVTPYFARRWTWSADRQTLTMRTFAGLTWHDGVPTTARDAAWTLDAARRVETGYPRRADLASLDQVVAPDDTTLILRFVAPQAGIPDALTDLALLPRHLLARTPFDQLRGAPWNRGPIGNGPFRFVSYQPNRRWVFEANPRFPHELGGPPRIRRFVVAVVDEPTTKLAALTSGELDFAGINPAHAGFVRHDPRLAVLDYPLLFSYALVFNTRRPPFDRLETRRSVAAAIDRAALVEGVLFGYATPATGPLPPELEVLRAATSAEPRESGNLPSGRPAVLPPNLPPSRRAAESPENLRFQLLTVGSGEAALEQMLQAQLAAAGIRAEIRQLELSTYLDRVQGGTPDFDAAVLGIAGDLGLGHLTQVVSIAGLRAGGSSERLVGLFMDSLPATFLYHARGVQGMNRRVHGVQMDIRGELVTLPQWTVRGKR